MQMILLFLFGWPGILLFMMLATIAAWKPSPMLMTGALILSLAPSLYLFGGNGWVQGFAFYTPLSLAMSIMLIKNKRYWPPRYMLIPVYVLYAWFGYTVLTQ